MERMENLAAVVLAAGKGTRMKSEHPKVVLSLAGKPLVHYVLDNLYQAGVPRILIVVGYKKEEVIQICHERDYVDFCEQKEQLGTGHALMVCEDFLKNFQGTLVVACGDAPMISSESFSNLIRYHNENKYAATVLTARIANPTGYGRILRNPDGTLSGIVEEKDATPAEREVKEVNTGTYCFDSRYVWDGLKSITNQNAQKEYYLTDLIRIFRSQNLPVGAKMLGSSVESYGINSPEDLDFLNKLLASGAPV